MLNDYDFHDFPNSRKYIFEEENTPIIRSLNQCKRIEVTPEMLDNYKKIEPELSHMRTGSNCKSFIWTLPNNDKEIVAALSVENKDDGVVWIQMLVVFPKYRRRGLGKQLLQLANTQFHATHLSVHEKNKPAIKLYERYGFKIYESHKPMYFMKK